MPDLYDIPPLPVAPPPIPFQWTLEQEMALVSIADWVSSGESFFALTGAAGTGKTTLVREIVNRYPGALAAMTGKAALRLSQLSDRDASTLHKILYQPPAVDEKEQKPCFSTLREPTSEFVIVDESSMITPSIFRDLQKWGELFRPRVLFVGDSFQLPPVVTGQDLKEFGEDYSVFAQVEGIALKTVMRNAGGVLRAATYVRETGEVLKKSDLDADGTGYQFGYSMTPIEDAVSMYLEDRDDHMLITWKNSNRMKANHMIRARLGHEGPLPDVGEPVLIRRNSGGFLNGEIVTCGGFDAGPMLGSLSTLWMAIQGDPKRLLISFEGGDEEKGGEPFDGQMPWIKDYRTYHSDIRKHGLTSEPCPVTFGYCLTAHSAQGSQARRTTVFLGQGDDKSSHFRKPTTLPDGTKAKFSARWLYTAQTRSTKHTTMVLG